MNTSKLVSFLSAAAALAISLNPRAAFAFCENEIGANCNSFQIISCAGGGDDAAGSCEPVDSNTYLITVELFSEDSSSSNLILLNDDGIVIGLGDCSVSDQSPGSGDGESKLCDEDPGEDVRTMRILAD